MAGHYLTKIVRETVIIVYDYDRTFAIAADAVCRRALASNMLPGAWYATVMFEAGRLLLSDLPTTQSRSADPAASVIDVVAGGICIGQVNEHTTVGSPVPAGCRSSTRGCISAGRLHVADQCSGQGQCYANCCRKTSWQSVV